MSASQRPLRDRLEIKYDFLVHELIPSYFVNKLYEKEVLCEEDKQQMTNPELGRYEQATRFVDTLMRKPESSIQIFLDLLRSQLDKQPHIYDELFSEPVCTYATTPYVSPQFVGRKKEVEDVLKKLTSCKFVCVVGPAGIGKSELAKQACERYLERKERQGKRLWVCLGQTVRTLSKAADLYRYIKAAVLAQLDGFKSIEDQRETDEDIMRQLDELFEPGSILLIDSCESCHNEELNVAIQRFIIKLLSSPREVNVIATSQRTLAVCLPNSDPNYRLSPLHEDDAVEMITVQSSFESEPVGCDRELLKRLVRHCSCFPLPLAIIRSLLQNGCSPQILYQCFEQSLKSKFSTLSPSFAEADIGDLPRLKVALQGCFDLLKSRNDTAYKSLLALSVLPQAFDEKARDAICSGVGARCDDTDKVHVPLEPMKEHCFLQPAVLLNKTKGFQMHTLIREFASEVRRESYSHAGELDEKARCNFIKYFSNRLREIGARYRENPIQSFKEFDCHMESFALLLRALTDEHWQSAVELPEIMNCIYDTFVSPSVGLLFVYRIPHKEQIAAVESLLGLIQTRRKEFEELAEARICFDLGKTLKTTWEDQNMKRSLTCFEETRKLLRDMHRSDASTRFLEADCLKALGRVRGRLAGHKEMAKEQRQEALEELQQSYKMFQDILGSGVETSRTDVIDAKAIKRKLVSCLKEQAEIQMWLQGPVQVCNLFEEVLKYRLELDGENHISTAQALLSLGKNYRLQSTKKNTKSKYQRQALLEQSELALKRAVKITSACGIERGPIAAKLFFQLGLVYKDIFRLSVLSKSESTYLALEIEFFEKAVDILRDRGPFPDLGMIYSNLGRARSDEGNFDAAVAAYKLAEEIYNNAGRGDYGGLYWSWAETCREQRKYEEELMLLRKSKKHLTDLWRISRAEKRIEEITRLPNLA